MKWKKWSVWGLKTSSYLLLFYFIYLLFLITIQYIPLRYDVAFLRIKQEEIQIPYYKIAFFTHVYSSIWVILLGSFQFSKTVRNKFPQIHRFSGKIYILLILSVSAPSGLIMSFYANGGIVSQISFSVLSVLWFLFTYKAFLFVKKQNWIKHKEYMFRSYALTLSAISLRLFKWGIVTFFSLPPMDTYRIVGILGWTFNLALVELYIFMSKRDV